MTYTYYIAIVRTDIARALMLFRKHENMYESLEYQDANHNTYAWFPVDITHSNALAEVTQEDADWFTQYAVPVDVQLSLFENLHEPK